MDNIGGNAFSFFDTELRMNDFVVSESWTDTHSGDSVHHISRGRYEVKRYNITDSTEGNHGGAGGDFWYPNSNSFASFANLVNNGGDSCFVSGGSGYFFSERLNIANNTRVAIHFIYATSTLTEFKECCLFKATSHPDNGTYAMVNCLTNYAHEGATVTETSFRPFAFNWNCPFERSHLFTKQKQIKGTKVLKTVITLTLPVAVSTP